MLIFKVRGKLWYLFKTKWARKKCCQPLCNPSSWHSHEHTLTGFCCSATQGTYWDPCWFGTKRQLNVTERQSAVRQLPLPFMLLVRLKWLISYEWFTKTQSFDLGQKSIPFIFLSQLWHLLWFSVHKCVIFLILVLLSSSTIWKMLF